MSLSPLIDLPVLPVRIVARALEALTLPPNSGSTLRGAFGGALKRLVCVRPDLARCEPCPHVRECAYPYLFETRALPMQPGTSGFADLPRPYVLRSPPGEQDLAPGAELLWDATLIGRAIDQLPHFRLSWHTMGDAGVGRGRGRFALERVDALDLNGTAVQVLYDRESNRVRAAERPIDAATLAGWAGGRSEAWPGGQAAGTTIGGTDEDTQGEAGQAPPAGPASTRPHLHTSAPPHLHTLTPLSVRFLTPTLLKHEGRAAARPEFHILWRNLQRRLSILRLAHGAGRPEIDFAASIRDAEAVRMIGWAARNIGWDRYSRRQDRRVPMGGFVGTARYEGDLVPFLPALALGMLVGVGDNCTFGQGHYRLDAPGDTTEAN